MGLNRHVSTLLFLISFLIWMFMSLSLLSIDYFNLPYYLFLFSVVWSSFFLFLTSVSHFFCSSLTFVSFVLFLLLPPPSLSSVCASLILARLPVLQTLSLFFSLLSFFFCLCPIIYSLFCTSLLVSPFSLVLCLPVLFLSCPLGTLWPQILWSVEV